MEDKSIDNKQAQPSAEKKAYKPPMLTVYGKLTDLTASGTMTGNESTSGPNMFNMG